MNKFKEKEQKIPFTTISNDIYKYAKMFSENNNKLEQCLKLLWSEEIETIGCCRGHNNKTQYIGISLNKNVDKIVYLLSSLDKKDIHISFVSLNDKVSCSIKKYKNKDIFDNIITSIHKNNIDINIKTITSKITTEKSNAYTNIHLYYFDNNLSGLYINTNDKSIIDKYITLYPYKILNEKNNLYHFDLTNNFISYENLI